MICIEAARDGFVILVGGRKMLVHEKRSPCLEIGSAELSYRRVRSSLCATKRRINWTPLREFSVVENSDERTVIDFSGLIQMSFRREDELLRLSFSGYDPSLNLFRLRLQAWPEECIFGLGERRSRLDLKGRRFPLWVDEGGAVREGLRGCIMSELRGPKGGDRGVSFPIPVYVSSQKYWCSVDTSAFTAFDFRRRATTTIETWAPPREIVIGSRPNSPMVASDLCAILGRQPGLPNWAYDGAWIGCACGEEDPEGMARELETYLEAGVKIAALWSEGGLESKASTRRPGWDLSSSVFNPELLKSYTAAWRERGIRYLSAADPYLNPSGPLFKEAQAKGFLVRSPEGGPVFVAYSGGRFALVDLSSAEASSWLQALLAKEVRLTGSSGFVADSGGLLPPEAILASGENAGLLHNAWPILWNELLSRAVSAGERRAESFFCMRTGWIGSSRLLPSAWAGGRSADFDVENGLASVVPAALSLGLSGIGSFHTEVGGYRDPAFGAPGPECLERWMEFAAFSPVFRTRARRGEEHRAKPELEADYLGHLARMTEIYAALKPYHLAVAEEYRLMGLPALRHPFVHYEGEAGLLKRDYQYLYGPDLFVAPTIKAHQDLTELQLPNDDWIHLWSSRSFRGGLVTVESPLGCPAVFYRASSPFASLFDSIRRTARRL